MLIERKILNLMFLDIKIPVVPTEDWLRVTPQSETKNSQSRFSPIIPPYFKDQIVARMRLLSVEFPDVTGHSTRSSNSCHGKNISPSREAIDHNNVSNF